MDAIKPRLASLVHLTRPLALAFVGIVLMSLGFAFLLLWLIQPEPTPDLIYYVLLFFIPQPWRALLLISAGLVVLGLGIWYLSDMVVLPMPHGVAHEDEIVVSSRRDTRPLRVVVMSGGAGILVLSDLSESVQRMTCITPVQDPVEYYYRASNLGSCPTSTTLCPRLIRSKCMPNWMTGR